MSNLAMVQDRDAVVVPFPKQGQQTMSDKQDGFTPLPNFLIDERYIAELPDQCVTILVVLNRHLNQKGNNVRAFSISLAQELCGFKDSRTAEKYLKVLVEWQLAIAIKPRGKVSLYSLNFTNPKPTKYLLSKQLPTCNVGTLPPQDVGACDVPTEQPPSYHVGTLPTQHEGTPPPCHGGLIKNSNKELNKSEEEGACEKIEPVQQQEKINPSQFFVEYKNEDWTSYSFKQVTEKYPSAIQDFISQGEAIFTDLSKTEILEELKKMSTWSVSAFKRTPQKWMVVWLNTFLPQAQERKTAEQRRIAEQQAEKHKPSPMDVNARYADQIAENKLDPNFVPTLILGEEFG